MHKSVIEIITKGKQSGAHYTVLVGNVAIFSMENLHTKMNNIKMSVYMKSAGMGEKSQEKLLATSRKFIKLQIHRCHHYSRLTNGT